MERTAPSVAAMLPDGTYDAIVVDAESTDGGGLRLELTILAGEQKGEVVTLLAHGLGVDEIDALGLPATMEVRSGEPRVVLDR